MGCLFYYIFAKLNDMKITEELLKEANRNFLLNKSRKAQNYKNQSKGKNRYERRTKSSISASTKDYNNIDMDLLFKRDILFLRIPVMGETDVYQVTIQVNGLLKDMQREVLNNKGVMSFKVTVSSLMRTLNTGDVDISCTCPDAKYRQNYWQTQNGYKAGQKEPRASKITNPNDTLGAGCKHVMLVLANLSWVYPTCSVITNYIKYCQDHLQRVYADYIFPKVYGIKYDKAIQLNLFDNGMLPNDRQTMDAVINKGVQKRDEIRNQKAFNKQDIEEPSEDNALGLQFEQPKKELDVEDSAKLNDNEEDNNNEQNDIK